MVKHGLMSIIEAFAFFESDSNLSAQGIRQDAVEYLNKTEFSPQQRKALNEAFIYLKSMLLEEH